MHSFRGSFIAGRFVPAVSGALFESVNPALPAHVVLRAVSDTSAVGAAVDAARAALPGWRRTPLDERVAMLRRLQERLPHHADGIARAITAEMGKPLSEARVEAASIGARLDGIVALLPHALPPSPDPSAGQQRWHSLGVTAVVGPFNYPIHLLNTYVLPALVTGNTVVAKPSEVTPLAGQLYAALFEDAGLPPGVFNLVQGLGTTGAALVSHPDVRNVIFTGSYHTGRAIREATFDQPWKKVVLELGGKNTAIVLDDADLPQATREILLGALLTTGQRCTATSRVIASPAVVDELRARLMDALPRVLPGDPLDEATFMGPLATRASRDRYLHLLQAAREEGAVVHVESRASQNGSWVSPSLYEARGPLRLLHEEAFGPNLVFEAASSEDDAIARAAQGSYGLSAAVFSARREMLERVWDDVPAGIVNFNRSTNGASGALPFGGIGRSGNFQPGGSLSPRLCTYPVAMMEQAHGAITANPLLARLLEAE